MFPGSENSIEQLVMLYLETGGEKFKIAGAKTGCTCISTSVHDNKEIPTATRMFFGIGELSGTSGNAPACNRKREIQYGGCQIRRTCISASKLVAKKFQRLTACFRARETQGRYQKGLMSKQKLHM
jgi:hypothetical protein